MTMPTEQKVRHLDAAGLITAVIDPDTYRSWDTPVVDPDPAPRVPGRAGGRKGKNRP